MKRRIPALAALCALLLASDLQAAPPAEEQIARSQAAVINALVAGAHSFAPLELRRARATLELARAALPDNTADAQRWAEQAELEANLAEARALGVRSAATVQPAHTAAAGTATSARQ